MRDLSLNILDIAQNSVAAGAKNVWIGIAVDTLKDVLTVTIKDNGCGMDEDFLKNAADPFTTTRNTRKVGLGLPLFKDAALITGGSFDIKSEKNKGTLVAAAFILDSFDRMPLGDITETMLTLVTGSKEIDFTLNYKVDGREFTFDTAEVKQTLGDVPLDTAEVVEFLRQLMNENIGEVNAGLII